jgi:Uma2 family endonuclease
MVAMTDTRTVLPDDRPLTIDDLDLLPDDGNKYELDDGLLVVSPAPANIHQLVLHRLSVTLAGACPATFLILPGPGLEISRTQYRVPDLAVVHADDFEADGKSVTRTPVLAIEIASPSTALYDRNRKKDVYARHGIESYWIVTPRLDKPALTAFELSRGEYQVVAEVSGDDTFRAAKPFACDVVPADLVAGPWQA